MADKEVIRENIVEADGVRAYELDGLKVTTFRDEILASIPVFGFLPTRSFLFLILKVPKDVNFTSSPFSKHRSISSKNISTNSADSLWDRPIVL